MKRASRYSLETPGRELIYWDLHFTSTKFLHQLQLVWRWFSAKDVISEQLKENEAKQKLEVKSCGQKLGLLKNLEHLFQEKTRGTAARVLSIKLSAMFGLFVRYDTLNNSEEIVI